MKKFSVKFLFKNQCSGQTNFSFAKKSFTKNFCSSSSSNLMIDKLLYKQNKDFASKFRDSDAFHYLYNTNLLNIINSMFLITKKFDNIVFMGNNPDLFIKKLPRVVEIENLIYCDVSEKSLIESKKRVDDYLNSIKNNQENNSNQVNIPKNIYPVLINQEKWPFKENSLDCVINNLFLHNVENFEEHLKSIRDSLVPDGCLLTNFFTTQTLNELKFSMGVAESEREGGVSTNVLTFPHIADVGNLLHKLNFSLPSMNIYKYMYKFDDLSGLFEFLELIGETNFLKNRRKFKSRDTFISTMAIYQTLYNSKTIHEDVYADIRRINVDMREDKSKEDFVFSSFEIGSLICWKYHPSQQKPKERGSAEFNLKELATDVLEAGKDEIRFGTVQLKDKSEDEFEIIEMTELIKEKN
jgi:NADH dehydrogenase [ubiquinone] 1 alpha subcomplex assembly factor 5